ncbi:MAG: mechanosensitive ion channel family protein [Anaerolineae bacterium]|jgi:small-conductance mechanosensitive channel
MDIDTQLHEFLQDTLRFIPSLIAALFVFFASLLLSSLATRSARRALRERAEDPELVRLLTLLIRWGLIGVGTLVALDQIVDVTGFIAGLGIVGFAVGFALQDIARNFVSGILLLIRQPFEIGDAVEAGGYSGTVLSINIRDTVISTWDGEEVIIPNADIYTQPIVNYSDLPLRRRTIRIGLGYEENVNEAVSVLLKAIEGTEGVLEDPAPTILATELGNSALQLEARFWVNQRNHGLFEVHSAVVQAISEAAEVEGIDLPYPIQTVRLEGARSFQDSG